LKLVESMRVKRGVPPKACKVALLGVAFRGDINDTRLSPSHDLAGLLKARGYLNVVAHDPYVVKDDILEELGIDLTTKLEDALRGAGIVIIATRHSDYKDLSVSKLCEMSGKNPIIVDAVNVISIDVEYDNLVILGKGHNAGM
ncbi:MAG: hypothetical protein J7L55_05480, partial [Desulfurococcales archaeon]|nr:hypothetical protein [Desulfurococcales archaeon]